MGWGKSSCHKYLHYQTIVFLVITLLIVMIMLREIMQAIMCFCHFYHYFEAEKGVRVLPHSQLCGLLCCLKIVSKRGKHWNYRQPDYEPIVRITGNQTTMSLLSSHDIHT